jgi:hypothetical protein
MTDTNKNYSKELTAKIIAEYSLNPTRATVDELAKSTGKTARSLIAKLSKENVYKKATKITKTGMPVIRKTDLVKIINEHYNLNLTSLVKATKEDLNKLVINLEN